MSDQLLFPTDGNDGAGVVLNRVVDMATAHDATLHLLYVAPPEPGRRPSLAGSSEDDGADDDPDERR